MIRGIAKEKQSLVVLRTLFHPLTLPPLPLVPHSCRIVGIFFFLIETFPWIEKLMVIAQFISKVCPPLNKTGGYNLLICHKGHKFIKYPAHEKMVIKI